MKIIIMSITFCFLFISCEKDVLEKDEFYKGKGTEKIVSKEGTHYAFTDIVFFNEKWFLVFRESDEHVHGKDGEIKVYSSFDGTEWEFMTSFQIKGIDLRDPKFSLDKKNNSLMLYFHGAEYESTTLIGRYDYRSVLLSSLSWNGIQSVVLDNLDSNSPPKVKGNEAWPWRVTWYNGVAYSIAYTGQGVFDIYQSEDGLFFKKLNLFGSISGFPTEATLRINKNDEFIILIRRNEGETLIGKLQVDELKVNFIKTIPTINFGGPNFVINENNKIFISGRASSDSKITVGNYNFESKKYRVLLELESGGESGYPGMQIKDNVLWISYYSSHENEVGTSIYITKVDLDNY